MTQTLQPCDQEQSKLLKESGFDWPTQDYITPSLSKRVGSVQSATNHNTFDGTYSVPTVALALKWLRDAKQIFVTINMQAPNVLYGITIEQFKNDELSIIWENNIRCNAYETAESAALTVALKILNKK